jgi:peptidoglycan/xylan/chitin deacetylase (PgdA/CDA1 family)
MSAVVLTYHAIDDGPPPLFVHPRVFRQHLDCLHELGVTTVTVSELADRLRAGDLGERTVAITFDDGFASVARTAAPLLAERDMRATVFCVAAHLGGENDWPTDPTQVPRRPLATAAELARLTHDGFEIGAHGMTHAPLHRARDEELHRELLDAKGVLEGEVGAPVRSLAYPYGLEPGEGGHALVREAYAAACSGKLRRVPIAASPHAIPRVDAHYVRRPALLRGVLRGHLDGYLAARRAGARARRLARRDYVS